ncbi:PEP-CTERM sorting domain-containing protein [Botrimarina hoheduenensis]|uniref:PEP-CTERM protein-sorting domain-containing protein n=1 Tax=Botrimarina hoheduenensis TaxID=2528000 RepID=A0A5C5WFA3_9BACT|nr:PEP-CTERM sorting domain-containing protein [Botrimarina hoheduenensis]TWT48769.1 hypothetical protein Pla111_05440 [Botrimarina hoheduenensis]
MQTTWRSTVIATLGMLILSVATSSAALIAIVDDDSGEFYFKNTGPGSFVLDAYAINSPFLSLTPGPWVSITGNYDSAGDQSVSSSPWFVLSATSQELAEAGSVSSGLLTAGEVVSLGDIYNPLGTPALTVRAFQGIVETPVAVSFRSLLGDYDDDLDVDVDDYFVFTATFGSTIDLRADGNNDGIVSAADYTIWRDRFEPMLGSAQARLALALGIPEPATAALLLVAMATGKLRCCRCR